MLANFDEAALRRASSRGGRAVLAALSLLLTLCATRASAQNTFNSGSDESNGAYAPTTSETKAVPDNGVFNFTTVNIPSGVTVTFVRNAKNTPVTILASGNVTIAGTLILDGKPGNTNGSGGLSGNGGFDGGSGGYPFDTSYTGVTGDGPGGGGGGYGSSSLFTPGGGGGGGYSGTGLNAGATGVPSGQPSGAGGPRYGTASLIPLIGGAGGGGGGAILIASSGNITFTGAIYARGGAGGAANGGANGAAAAGGGGGSGGAIRLVTNTITGSGGSLQVAGGAAGTGGGGGGNPAAGGSNGYIRVEAYDHGAFTTGVSNTISYVLPRPALPPNLPTLRIASVAGFPAPTSPLGSQYHAPDIIIPPTQPNPSPTPVEVVVEATNIPDGTTVDVTLAPSQGSRTTAQSTGLAASTNPPVSTATATVYLPVGRSVITASVVINMTLTAAARTPLFIDGERVDRIEVTATFGGGSELTFVTHSGRRVRRTYE